MPSAAYDRALAEATAHHASSKTYSGKFLRPHKPFLVELIQRLGVTSILDYGCGKGAQYEWVDPADGKTLEQSFGCTVSKYDPAWPPFAAEPTGQFDLVICTHVLGTIPIVDQTWLFGRLFGFATKAVYIAEKVGPVKKKVFSDPTVMPHDFTPERWLAHAGPYASDFAGETHMSFRYRDDADDSVYVDRYRFENADWIKSSNRPK